jgi:hypothetical protein
MVAARGHPAESGASSCAFLGKQETAFDGRFRNAVAAVAATKARCPAVIRWLENYPCFDRLECGEALCDSATLDASITKWLVAGVDALRAPDSPQSASSRPRIGCCWLRRGRRALYPRPSPCGMRGDTTPFTRQRLPIAEIRSGGASHARAASRMVPVGSAPCLWMAATRACLSIRARSAPTTGRRP